ncbi:hypothetical protein GCM10007304_30160 [Rhodococcoides trifolii]|uniref:Uncharacterized protein n=2 Tax=Rhodococcoides trifolii TaxID=908250 RepID=A0A917FYC9_9NOCA|nr:hypothetical protein GCM10007304_30160 [Rhodococcus trifolii]
MYDYSQILGAITPWFPLVGPCVAGLLVWIGWSRTHELSSERDYRNWQRTLLADLSISLNNAMREIDSLLDGGRASAFEDTKTLLEKSTEIYGTILLIKQIVPRLSIFVAKYQDCLIQLIDALSKEKPKREGFRFKSKESATNSISTKILYDQTGEYYHLLVSEMVAFMKYGTVHHSRIKDFKENHSPPINAALAHPFLAPNQNDFKRD